MRLDYIKYAKPTLGSKEALADTIHALYNQAAETCMRAAAQKLKPTLRTKAYWLRLSKLVKRR